MKPSEHLHALYIYVTSIFVSITTTIYLLSSVRLLSRDKSDRNKGDNEDVNRIAFGSVV